MPNSRSPASSLWPFLGAMLVGGLIVYFVSDPGISPAPTSPERSTESVPRESPKPADGRPNDNTASRGLGQPFLEGPKPLDTDTIHWLGELVHEEPYPDTRRFVIGQLQGVPGREALDILSSALGDSQFNVREEAIAAVGEHGPAGVFVLGQVLHNEPRGTLREHALRLLADIRSPASRVLVQHAAEHDPLNHIREQAHMILADWPDEPMPAMTQLLEFPEDQFAQIELTWQLPEEEATEILGVMLASSPHEDVRLQSVLELGQIGHESAIEPLSLGLGDRQAEVRSESLFALAAHGDRSTHLLGQALISDPDPFVRSQAAQLLAEDNSPAARALLKHALNDKDATVRDLARGLLER